MPQPDYENDLVFPPQEIKSQHELSEQGRQSEVLMNKVNSNLTGKRFGRLTVICFDHKEPRKNGGGNILFFKCKCDCVKFVEREIRRGNKYDAIIMDPPSYGRGPKGETWKIEESIYPFIELTTNILSESPLFFLINSYTTGLQPAVLSYMMNMTIVSKFGGRVVSDEIGLPVKDTGLILPCGASGRWERVL